MYAIKRFFDGATIETSRDMVRICVDNMGCTRSSRVPPQQEGQVSRNLKQRTIEDMYDKARLGGERSHYLWMGYL